jgi:hypothetical protein
MVLSDMVRGCVRDCVEECCGNFLFHVLAEPPHHTERQQL